MFIIWVYIGPLISALPKGSYVLCTYIVECRVSMFGITIMIVGKYPP